MWTCHDWLGTAYRRGIALALLCSVAPLFGQTPTAGSSARTDRSMAEIQATIAKAGTTMPDWWDSVPLEFPNTLDLSWTDPPPKSPWNPSKNVGQYLWSIINENPSRWQKGAKFMHHVAQVNANRTEARRRAWDALGHIYADLLQDYARGAYCWEKSGSRNMVGLASCYWRLGNRQRAAQKLKPITFDGDRYGGAVRLWADMGFTQQAMSLAESSAKRGNPGGAYLAAGHVCRLNGDYAKALQYFEKVSTLDPKGQRYVDFQKPLALSAIEAIRNFEALDIKTSRDGTYHGNSLSFAGDLELSVKVAGGRITEVKILKHKDKQFYAAMTEIPLRIVAKQSLRDIDAITGATITSDAIVNATAKALVGAR